MGLIRLEIEHPDLPFPLLFGIRYRFPAGNNFFVSTDLNLGSTFGRVETRAFDFSTEESAAVLTLGGGAGAGVKTGPGDFHIGLHYRYSGVDFIGTGSRNLSGFLLRFGYFLFLLPSRTII